jgi:hypothetical protein
MQGLFVVCLFYCKIYVNGLLVVWLRMRLP